MSTLILSGPLGVGKTTIRRRLISEYGYWSPVDVTTRPVDDSEVEKLGVRELGFRSAVLSGKVVMPVFFAGTWYGWWREDFDRMLDGSTDTVIDVRPQTALLLSALNSNSLAIWLWIEPEILQARRNQRTYGRDHDINTRRIALDSLDDRFEAMFRYRIRADDSALTSILSATGNDSPAP